MTLTGNIFKIIQASTCAIFFFTSFSFSGEVANLYENSIHTSYSKIDDFREIFPYENQRKNEKVGYVVSDDPSWGRLGNQLFAIATVLAYAWDYGFKPVFPYLNRADKHLSYNRDKIFFRLDASTDPINIDHRYICEPLKYAPIPKFSNDSNVSLQGQYVNWRYFHHQYKKLLSTFAPSAEVINYLKSKYGDLLSKPNTVAVHVRTYSKFYHDCCLPFVGLNFFKIAFEQFPTDSTFVVFSDRINWCKLNFYQSFPDKDFVFIEENDHIEDLFLMSMMKHQIISNSTYSWWGAYLNQNPEKIVYCPQQFNRIAASFPIEEFCLPGWRIIHYDFTNEPYPEDMTFFDKITADDKLDYN